MLNYTLAKYALCSVDRYIPHILDFFFHMKEWNHTKKINEKMTILTITLNIRSLKKEKQN